MLLIHNYYGIQILVIMFHCVVHWHFDDEQPETRVKKFMLVGMSEVFASLLGENIRQSIGERFTGHGRGKGEESKASEHWLCIIFWVNLSLG